jgi:cytochrome c553
MTLALLLAAGGLARAAAPGRLLASACASCHGADARGAAIPGLAGLSSAQMEQRLLAYRASASGPQIMRVVAGALSPTEITAIARYLAAAPP